jgi:cell division protein FtsB
MNYWVVVYRLAWGLLLVLFVIGLICIFLPKCHRIRELHRTRMALEEQNRRTEEKIRELKENQERFGSDPAFVELTARRTGRVKTNEHLYRYTNEVPETVR